MSTSLALSSRLAVVRSAGSFSLFVTEPVGAGEEILRVSGTEGSVPSRHSLQVGASLHVDAPPGVDPIEALDLHLWRFLDHACDPAAGFRGRTLVARRPLAAWSPVTFDYATTEWDMAEPFDCACGAPTCRGSVRGYRWLSTVERRRIDAWVQPWLRELAR